MINANEFLNIMVPLTQTTYRLGTVDSIYISGRPQIIFDGETIASTKQYPYMASYTPYAGDRVLMLIVANSFVILGKII